MPVDFEITTTSGSLKESVQKGQVLIWHRKDRPEERVFQIANIAVAFLRSETGGELVVTFSCNVSSLGYMTSEEAKIEYDRAHQRRRLASRLGSWSFSQVHRQESIGTSTDP